MNMLRLQTLLMAHGLIHVLTTITAVGATQLGKEAATLKRTITALKERKKNERDKNGEREKEGEKENHR